MDGKLVGMPQGEERPFLPPQELPHGRSSSLAERGRCLSTGKRTAAGIGVVALLAIAIGLTLSWQEIQVQYHLYRLRNEPGCLKDIVSAPENTPQRLAMVELGARPLRPRVDHRLRRLRTLP